MHVVLKGQPIYLVVVPPNPRRLAFERDVKPRPQEPPTAPENRHLYLDVNTSAEYIGVSTRWMRRCVERRLIPFHKVGRLVRFDRRDLDAFLAQGRVEKADPWAPK
jgi:excisionase family DNA binding protein